VAERPDAFWRALKVTGVEERRVVMSMLTPFVCGGDRPHHD
jgi:hypothetical protein